MAKALLALGSNLGDRRTTLETALRELETGAGMSLCAVSELRETAPIGGPGGQSPFLNGAALVETDLAPGPLLARLHAIEALCSRTRETHWAARTLDLDLLLYDNLTLRLPPLPKPQASSPKPSPLEIPHPRMAFRRFVLEPAAEIAPEWIHPTTGWSLLKLLRRLEESPPVLRLTGEEDGLMERIRDLVARQPGWCIFEADTETPPRLTVHIHRGTAEQLPPPIPGSDSGPTLHVSAGPAEEALKQVRAALEAAE